LREEGFEPSSDDKERLLEKVEREYPHTTPYNIVTGVCENPEEIVERVSKDIKPTSSPGLPLAELAMTNKSILEKFAPMIVKVVLARLELLVSGKWDGLSAVDLVKQGFCDPVRVFVKNEPHKVKKLDEELYRLISSVSMIDQLIERLIAAPQNQAEIDNWRTCPSKPGMGFTKDSQAQELIDMVASHLEEASEADISRWDWSVKRWQQELEALARTRLAGQSKDSRYARIVKGRFYCICRPVLVLSDGRMYILPFIGLQLSGSYMTSSGNSRMRVKLAWEVGADWAIANGDDDVETTVPDAVAKYKKRGFTVKMYTRCKERQGLYTGGFEFCSHYFVDGVAKSLNIVKGTVNLLSGALTEDRLRQWKMDNRHSLLLPVFEPVISRVWQGHAMQPRKDPVE
jgi:hypothetical protein